MDEKTIEATNTISSGPENLTKCHIPVNVRFCTIVYTDKLVEENSAMTKYILLTKTAYVTTICTKGMV